MVFFVLIENTLLSQIGTYRLCSSKQFKTEASLVSCAEPSCAIVVFR